MKRDGIHYPKFKDQFALMDFEAEPMPTLSLFPAPKAHGLGEWRITLRAELPGAARIGHRTAVWGDRARSRVRVLTSVGDVYK